MDIISASRRTDIPAFYSRWFLNRVRAGYCLSINPFSGKPYRVSLRPEDVIAFVFWTRNPLPLLPHLDELDREGYRYYFHCTLTGYGRVLDTQGPDPRQMIETLRRLADRIGPEWLQWRYDPIVLTAEQDAEYHRRSFARLCAALEGSTRRCHISFLQLYRKNRGRLDALAGGEFEYACLPVGDVPPPRTGRFLPLSEAQELAADLGQIAAAHGIRVYTCCYPLLAQPLANVYPAHCIDPELIARLRPDLELHLKANPTRKGCGCCASRDIGAYDTCAHGCVYCYATRSHAAACAALRRHDSEAECLDPGFKG